MQLTAFLPSGIVVRLPAALLACFSLQALQSSTSELQLCRYAAANQTLLNTSDLKEQVKSGCMSSDGCSDLMTVLIPQRQSSEQVTT